MRSLMIFDEKPAHLAFSNLTGPVAPVAPVAPDGGRTLEHNPAHGDILTMPGPPRVRSANPIRPGARGEVEGLFLVSPAHRVA